MRFKKTVFFISLAVLLLVPFSVYGFSVQAEAASVTVENGGITFTCRLQEDGTAVITGLSQPDSPQVAAIPETVTSDGQTYTVTQWSLPDFFSKVRQITGFQIPDTVTEITGSFGAFPDLTEITIPGSVKIFRSDFQSCKVLKNITFSEGVEEIDCSSMLSRCDSLTSIHLPDTLQVISSNHTFSDAVSLKEIHLPDQLRLTNIGTFADCTSLKSVSLPSGMTDLPGYTFSGCTALETVTAEDPLSSIGEKAFQNCESLTSVPDLGTVASMGKSAFEGCLALEFENGLLDLSSLDVIPDRAFYGAGSSYQAAVSGRAIHQVAFSSTLQSIGSYAFSNCLALWKDLTFPDSLQSIGDNAFESIASLYGLSSQTSVTIPDSVTSLGRKAFLGACVREVYIGSGISDILPETFAYLSGTETPLRKITFHNAEDMVRIAEGAIPDGTEIVWLEQSIGDVGDTISDEPDSLTLQEAVNAAPDETPSVIVISKHIRLDTPLVVPAQKKITITSPEGEREPYTILGSKTAALSELITVETGSEVTFQHLILSGAAHQGSILSNHGTAVIAEGAVIKKGTISSLSGPAGVIENEGESAVFYLTGGSLEDNQISALHSGVIRVTGGASAYIQGGTIQNNVMSGTGFYASSSGILLYENSYCQMSGGIIAGNRAIRGSAVMLYSLSETKQAVFELKDGLISDNRCSSTGPQSQIDAGGAVAVEGNAVFTMNGGYIQKNTGAKGAGVSVLDHGLLSQNGEFGTSFLMNGGTITENAGTTGGGLYSYSNGVQLHQGVISKNTASHMGGGIYCEGNTQNYSTLFLRNAVITNNHSGDQGGGLWLCSTGDAKVYVTNGGAIYGNTADGAGDDIVSVESFDSLDSSLTLAKRLLGGGRVLWYRDGSIYRSDPNLIYASTNREAGRYGDSPSSPIEVTGNRNHLALKSILDPSAAALAEQTAALFITENQAGSYGGGIGANGGVVIGEDRADLISIPVKKIWDHRENPEDSRPASVTVHLMYGDTVMDSLVLDGSSQDEYGNWTGVFEDLLPGLPYTIAEENTAHYSPEITGTITDGFLITNTFHPANGSLTVSKTVSGSGASPDQAFPFTVTIPGLPDGVYGELEFQDGVSSFSLKHGESKTASDLPAGLSYTVSETGQEGYTVSSQNASGMITENTVISASFHNRKNGGTGPGQDTGTSLTVRKIWKLDDGGTRTDSVRAVLLRDGEPYETVLLNQENHWTHTWQQLDGQYTWTVAESEVPDGFQSSIRQTGRLFLIINDDLPEQPTLPELPDSQEPSEETGLPKTGLRLHPAWLSAALSLILLAWGIFLSRKSRVK